MTPPSPRPQTVTQCLARGVIALAKSSDSARADAQLLLAHALGCDRAWLVARGEAELTAAQTRLFRSLCDARARGKPIAYILRSAWFYGREFVVDESVLVPRPETEHLVDEAIDYLRAREDAGGAPAVLDVGVGCGAIGCSIAAEIPSAIVDGIDSSPAAVRIAELNARRLQLFGRCNFRVGDAATIGRTGNSFDERRYDAIVANLPYVPTADIARPPDPVSFEPREALDGGADGMECYRRFLPGAARVLKTEGVLLMEAAPPSVWGLVELASTAFENAAEIEALPDYGGRLRYVRVRRQRVPLSSG